MTTMTFQLRWNLMNNSLATLGLHFYGTFLNLREIIIRQSGRSSRSINAINDLTLIYILPFKAMV